MFNGMINTSFAAYKSQKQNSIASSKMNPPRLNQPQPTSFKEIREMKEANQKVFTAYSHKKILENQQNTLQNTTQQPWKPSSYRKNWIRVDRSNKKGPYAHLYKSPSNKIYETKPLFKKDTHQDSSLYSCKASGNKNNHFGEAKTPYLSKGNRSFMTQEATPINFMTQKQRTLDFSQKGSISISSKQSINGSFRLPTDNDFEEDEKQNDNVNSSMEMKRTQARPVNEFSRGDIQSKVMKKSTQIYCSQNYTNEDNLMEQKSVTSSLSSNVSRSINFSQKFKHYKKHQNKDKPITLSQFDLIREIGSGKYGKVFLARHKQSGFICALKSVSKKVIREQNLQTPFIRQIKIQMFMNHPNIVKLYGFFYDNQNIYLVMEYCSGQTLLKLIREQQRFQQKQIISILANIFQAVSFLHCQGVIHRDLKPQNIVIENDVYKICDFGWAAYARGDNRTTFCGTPLYVCPEVLKGEQYNTKADIWGLGIITYQLAFGQVPFSIMNQNDLLKIIRDPVYFPVWGNTAEQLVPFTKRMLSKNAEERPSLNQVLSSEIFKSLKDMISPKIKEEMSLLL